MFEHFLYEYLREMNPMGLVSRENNCLNPRGPFIRMLCYFTEIFGWAKNLTVSDAAMPWNQRGQQCPMYCFHR